MAPYTSRRVLVREAPHENEQLISLEGTLRVFWGEDRRRRGRAGGEVLPSRHPHKAEALEDSSTEVFSDSDDGTQKTTTTCGEVED